VARRAGIKDAVVEAVETLYLRDCDAVQAAQNLMDLSAGSSIGGALPANPHPPVPVHHSIPAIGQVGASCTLSCTHACALTRAETLVPQHFTSP
jgi:hypothetical protein